MFKLFFVRFNQSDFIVISNVDDAKDFSFMFPMISLDSKIIIVYRWRNSRLQLKRTINFYQDFSLLWKQSTNYVCALDKLCLSRMHDFFSTSYVMYGNIFFNSTYESLRTGSNPLKAYLCNAARILSTIVAVSQSWRNVWRESCGSLSLSLVDWEYIWHLTRVIHRCLNFS